MKTMKQELHPPTLPLKWNAFHFIEWDCEAEHPLPKKKNHLLSSIFPLEEEEEMTIIALQEIKTVLAI